LADFLAALLFLGAARFLAPEGIGTMLQQLQRYGHKLVMVVDEKTVGKA